MQEKKQSLIKESSLTCIKNRDSIFMCTTDNCKQPLFICNDNKCSCNRQKHYKCSISNREYILSSLDQIRKDISQQNQQSFNIVLKIYDDMIDQLSQQRNKFAESIQMFGLSRNLRQFVNMINDGRSVEIDGNFGFKIKSEIEHLKQNPITFEKPQLIKNSWQADKKQFNKIIKKLQNFSNSFQPNILQSNYLNLQNLTVLKQFFPKKIIRLNLLYRASENDFTSQSFHKKCDNIPNNLTILETQYGKIIGGFTPIQWKNHNPEQAKYDPKNQSFLFSITLKQKYPLKEGTVAIYQNKQYGPLFGFSGNLAIANHCDETHNWAKFNTSYNNDPYQNEPTFLAAFVGTTGLFKIKDYQFFQVILQN